ncbi:hypothetical protein BJ986_002267 [Phycicoccus badiiscoriae]|uniref:Uncharacterized protein n=1 Tax=Pedococcus badiiscoriae TaxID=642776 RepID=A0A852WG64_9MICO|nr:hypothetical protein [Pedococcus badiiscoriae]NYG07780.1 hypothetical protein [Pedococcus badiiscoriae]
MPTGKLMLTINGGYSTAPGRSSIFGDGSRQTIEERLPELLQELEVRALELQWAQEKRERDARARQALWEAEVDRARERLVEAHRGEVLEEQVTAWERAQRIRTYVAALQLRVSALEDPAQAEAATLWVDWAAQFAEHTDPLVQSIGLPADPPISLETLGAHLRWNGPPGDLPADPD